MDDRCLFIQSEISCAFVDDFMVLPAACIVGNIYQGLTPHVERHHFLFYLTH